MDWFKSNFKWLLFLTIIPLVAFCSIYSAKETASLGADVIVSSSGKKYYTGLIIPKDFQPKIVRSALADLKNKGLALPESYDLKTLYSLESAENQGSCGSCWAFSITGVMKDNIKIHGGNRRVSQQFLLDCNTNQYSCEGGFFESHNLHKAPKGAVTWSDYSYTGSQGQCKSGLKYNETITSWAYLPGGDNVATEEIKSAIYQYGTVAVGVAADQSMSNYTGGKFNGSGATDLNHAVNLVGWTADGYWIMKNSWGSSWGENGGYMQIKFGANLIGAQANYVIFNGNSPDPTPNPDPNPTPNPTPGPNPDPTPGPTPNPTPGPGPCSPAPIASTNHPAEIKIRRNQTVYLGTKPVRGTSYTWRAVPEFNGGAVPREAYIKFTPSVTKVLTIFATNKCGTAQATTKVTVTNFAPDIIQDLQQEL